MPDSNPAELFRFISKALPEDTFHVTHFSGTEGLNRAFSFTIDLVSENPALDGAAVLAAQASLHILRDNGQSAIFQGYPVKFEQGGLFNGYAYYSVELRPAFWHVKQVVQSAIFLDKNVQDVTHELLQSQPFFNIPHEFRLTRTDYPTPEFAMQYGESVYDYILWRMEEQGAYFYFAPDGDTVIFADSPDSHTESSATVYYSPTSGLEGERREEVLTSFTLTETPLPRRVVVRSFDWKDPKRPVIGMADVSSSGLGDVYLSNENVGSDAEASRIATIRAEELRSRGQVFSGAGSVPVLRPGVVFTLNRHYREDFNRDYLVTECTHEGSQETFLSMGLGIPLQAVRDHLFYRNSFFAIASDVPFRPARKAPRAVISGVIRAFVDGAGSGARAELDEYGRYKLLFPFDISGREKGKASCWIRMAQSQVGKDHGMSFPLLPGAEVTVAFLDGNPDRPIITGSIPNGETGAITGAGNVNFSGIRTPGGNQLTFNDTDTHQGFSLQAPSGLGLSMSAGSLGATTQHNDVAMDISSVLGTEVANLGKTLLSGCKITSSANMNCYALLTALGTGLQNSVCGIFDSLAAKAAKDKEKGKENILKWSSDAVKTACLAFVNIVSTVKGFNTPANTYGISLLAKEGASTSTLQVWPGWGKMLSLILTWIGGRITQFTTETVDTIEDVAKAEKKAQEQMDKDLKDAGASLPEGSSLTDESRKTIYNETVDALVQEINKAMNAGDAKTVQKLQNELAALQKDYAALFDDTSDTYYKYAKADTLRKAMVSAAKDILPEITAIILQFKLFMGEFTEHGGIGISSVNKNINLNALTTISLHSGDGIFLNTAKDAESGTFGVSSTKNYAVGKKTVNQLKPFVAVKTTNRYVEAENNEEEYLFSHRISECEITAHKDGKDYIALAKDSATIHAKNVSLEADSGNQSSLVVNGDGIAIFADTNHSTGISVNKEANTLSLHNQDACLGIKDDGSINIKSKDGAKVVVEKSIVLSPSGGQVYLDDICVNGTELSARDNGMMNLGGQVKIMGKSAKNVDELRATVTELLNSVKEQTETIKAAQTEAETAKTEAKTAAEAAAASAKAAQEAQVAVVEAASKVGV